ncbi:organic hydroperoxide reductase OsmC/OhrA [Arcticibacter tournemirensis]|uniref:OsmC family protein n=1 Tax=Arcticibacter tournemirensis TaxID=699437 RepID=UPI0011536A0B|nr:OsmC family protein [Arcticibacter tournemirensis]TQM51627.1 organic hydroperoxide reductase OsmC/OhrA [Arcticibacter tournemirensis]
MKEHSYKVKVNWTGNPGEGTSAYNSYKRTHTIEVENKAVIQGSSMPQYRGDADLHNPEDLLLASVSSCHMLWYLHLCATAGVIVVDYEDNAEGIMVEEPDGSGRFTSIILKPVVTVAQPSMVEKALELHKDANRLCFIANSLNFKIGHLPECKAQQA